MKYLLTRTDIYRCDDDTEAENFVQELKSSGMNVVASTIQQKERKSKGEIIDSYSKLTVKVLYNDEKEPDEPYNFHNEDEE